MPPVPLPPTPEAHVLLAESDAVALRALIDRGRAARAAREARRHPEADARYRAESFGPLLAAARRDLGEFARFFDLSPGPDWPLAPGADFRLRCAVGEFGAVVAQFGRPPGTDHWRALRCPHTDQVEYHVPRWERGEFDPAPRLARPADWHLTTDFAEAAALAADADDAAKQMHEAGLAAALLQSVLVRRVLGVCARTADDPAVWGPGLRGREVVP